MSRLPQQLLVTRGNKPGQRELAPGSPAEPMQGTATCVTKTVVISRTLEWTIDRATVEQAFSNASKMKTNKHLRASKTTICLNNWYLHLEIDHAAQSAHAALAGSRRAATVNPPFTESYPRRDADKTIGVFLTCSKSHVTAKGCIHLLRGPESTRIITLKVECDSWDAGWGASCWDSVEDLFEGHDQITFRADVKVYDEAVTSDITEYHGKTISLPSVAPAMRKLYQDRTFTDVVIRVGGEEIGCHKCILGVQSPVFKAMFQHGMKESLDSVVEIDDISHEVMHALIEYMYTGNLKENVPMDQTLVAAEKYSLDDLAVHCMQSMVQNISVETAPLLLRATTNYAHLTDASTMKSHCLNFIAQNLRAVMNSKIWKSMVSRGENTLLLQDILTEVAASTRYIGRKRRRESETESSPGS